MANTYRVTPLRKKWIVQRVSDRKQIGKSFELKSNAAVHLFNLDAKAAETTNNKASKLKIIEAYRVFADWKLEQANEPGSRYTTTSAKRYDMDYRLRISKHMPDKLLSDFKHTDMEAYLYKCHQAGDPYKTLKNCTRNIKCFIRRMKLIGANPCTDVLTFKIHEYQKVVPQDDNLYYEADVQILKDEEVKKILNLFHAEAPTNQESAYTFALMCVLFIFGLRMSEVLGLHKANVDFENNLLHIKGSYIQSEGGYINKTKNRGSKRPIEMDENAIKFFDWWLGYLDHHHKYSVYLFPAFKAKDEDKPICYKTARNLIWKAYARMGLAEISIPRDGHVVVHKSDFKGAPSKMFRHKFCNALYNAMNSDPLLTANYAKQSSGHTQFKTFAERYGNKPVRGTADERAARANAKRKALNTDIVPNTKLITK